MISSSLARLRRAGWLPLILLLAVRLALGLAYSLTVPPWESYDEDGHFAYAHYLARHRTLLLGDDAEAQAIWEKFQPPLYYILASLMLAGSNLDQPFQTPERNPYLTNGNAGVNYALHPSPPNEQNTIAALLRARTLSVLISTASVIFVYLAARRVWSAEARAAPMVWAATCLYAFWPQFLFVGSMVTNDMLVTALAAALLYLMTRLATETFRLRHALLLGLLLGCALLTKLNAVALVPSLLAALLSSIFGARAQRASPKGTWGWTRAWAAFVSVGVLLASALWALGSLRFVTGQIFQLQTLADFLRYAPGLGGAAQGSDSHFIFATLQYGFRTFVASFGWGNLETYPWLYGLWALGTGLAAIGWVLNLVRGGLGARLARLRLFIIMGLQIITLVALAVALAIAQQDPFLVPGRYLLPGLPAASLLLVGGWRQLIPAASGRLAWKGLSVGVLLVGWSIPLWTLAPAYARPRPLTSTIETPLALSFDDGIELLGLGPLEPARPGGEVPITLCWRAAAPVARNYSILLEVVGPDGQGYGRLESYPGRGNYPTSAWAVNQAFCDHYSVSIGEAIPAPSLSGVRVSLLDGVNGKRLPVRTAAGEALNPDGAQKGVPLTVRAAGQAPQLAQRVDYRFGEGLRLTGYEIKPVQPWARSAQVVLRWEALADSHEDYTVFVHLRDTPTTAYAQGDGPPQHGWYPTSLWQKGEAVLDEHTLPNFPEGTTPPLALYVGVINIASGQRLPAFDASGQPIPNGEVILARDLRFTFPAFSDFVYLPIAARSTGEPLPPSTTLPSAYP